MVARGPGPRAPKSPPEPEEDESMPEFMTPMDSPNSYILPLPDLEKERERERGRERGREDDDVAEKVAQIEAAYREREKERGRERIEAEQYNRMSLEMAPGALYNPYPVTGVPMAVPEFSTSNGSTLVPDYNGYAAPVYTQEYSVAPPVPWTDPSAEYNH
ncbi:hypothetical protein KIPB_010405 [Kipferlia bialata]|uniref:Uncharacterized protein n=1 Tax=Kipferlia bialata TaxID=797122 RepID=A0A391NS50_9EUKA|nr:hypothetical protein KIPB_010405 [Kipferlia bialata]|eukprot:g10405.t1